MLKYLFVFFLVSNNIIFSQKDYITFHSEIIDAESEIIKENYASASEKYYAAFKGMDFVFLANCVTACSASIRSNNDSLTLFFVHKAIEHGLTMEKIQNDSILAHLKTLKIWLEIEKNYNVWLLNYSNRINPDLRKKVNSLYAIDRYWRDRTETHPMNILWRSHLRKKWYNALKIIVEDSLMPLIYKYGYLGEKIIGVDKKSDHLKFIGEHNKSFMVRLILIHYYSSKRPLSDSIFFREIQKGNLHPKQFAEFADFKACFSDEKSSSNVKIYAQWMWNQSNSSEETIKEINKRRLAIGIGTYEQRMSEFKHFIRTNNAPNRYNKIIPLVY